MEWNHSPPPSPSPSPLPFCFSHRSDLKPENILMDNDGHVNLTDFGLSKATKPGDATSKTFCGTPEYLGTHVRRQFGVVVFSCLLRLHLHPPPPPPTPPPPFTSPPPPPRWAQG